MMSSSGLDLYYINSYVLSDVLSIVVTIVRLRESLTFVTLPETTVTSNKSYSYLHWVTIVMINSND
jgi:hypothetical protein